jgi:glycosyltransferase involved in cell wall biosynthesis
VPDAAAPSPSRASFAPVWITEVEIGEPIVDLRVPERPAGLQPGSARALVRLHGQPLGFVDLALAGGVVSAEAITAAVDAELGPRVAAHLAADGLPAARLTTAGLVAPAEPACLAGLRAAPAPWATVVICTRDRADSLRRTLRSVLDLRYPAFEVVVVDNSPKTSATKDVIAELGDERLRYVLEPRPGLSCARNRGLAEATGEIVAFTDDDVIADAGWLAALVRGFARADHVGLVTGLVPAAELETEAQAYFDAKLDWAELFEPAVYDLDANRAPHPTYPYSAGLFGAGANFAVRAGAARAIGRFDEALGAGSPSRGGEDLDYFLRTILGGHAIAYEPAALVWHVHRRDEAGLVAQMFGYGSGLTAYVFKHLVFTRGTARTLLRLVPMSIRRYAATQGEARRATTVPPGAQLQEYLGLVAGPWLYVKGRRRRR